MEAAQQRAVLTLCLMAASADNASEDRERAAILRVAESLGAAGEMAAIHDEVGKGTPDIATVASVLRTSEERRLAYEMAVGVCDADGAASAAEREFLDRLARVLGLPAAGAQQFAHEADAVASVPPSSPALDGALVAAVPAGDADLDKMILNYAILNGALELLPQSLASMAIIPLQMRMVYRIGKAHGFELDSGHIKDLLATLGVGLTSQYLEQFGRKLLGGLLGGIGSVSAGAALSFATTYALGQVAKRYYAGGRTIDASGLQRAFSDMLAQAKQLQGKYTSQIAEQARTLDLSRVMAAIRS